MTRVLLTGMCTAADRLVSSAGDAGIAYELYPDLVKTKSEVLSQFRMAANLGNYLISEGAYHAIKSCKTSYLPFWYLASRMREADFLEDLKSCYDMLVFVTANILHTEFDISDEVYLLNGWNKPIVIMSAGLQSTCHLSKELPAATAAFLALLRRKDVFTFTRGPTTSAFLRKNGAVNLFDASCPSAFLFPEAILKSMQAFSRGEFNVEGEVWLNGYYGNSPTTPIDIKQFSNVSRSVSYVYQDEPLLSSILSECPDDTTIFLEETCTFVKHLIVGHNDIPYNVNFLAFFDPKIWRARGSTIDFSVGRRFHGNLVVMQSGRPALFVSHDDRVQDMLLALGLPSIHATDWETSRSRLYAVERAASTFVLSRSEDIYLGRLEKFRQGLRYLGLF